MNKITFIIGGLRGGGAEKVCVTLANGLADRGYDIDLVVLNLGGAIRDKELSSNVNLTNLKVGHARYSAFALWRYLRIAQPATVLSFNRQISVVLGLVRKLGGLHFRLISRCITFLSIADARKKGLWHGFVSKHLIRRFYALSDLLIAQSHAMKADLVAYLGFPESRVKVIHNPISKEVELVRSNRLTDVGQKDYLLCVGHLEPVKAFHYAIAAFASIAPDYPHLHLKIVGKGSLEARLKEQAYSLGVADRVDFEGYQTDIIPYYLGARATLLTSQYEGFPNVLVESIALGTPVVAFDCPSGPGEIVKNGVNGFLVQHLNEEHLDEGLKKVLNAEWSGEVLSASVEHFRSAVIIEEYVDVLAS